MGLTRPSSWCRPSGITFRIQCESQGRFGLQRGNELLAAREWPGQALRDSCISDDGDGWVVLGRIEITIVWGRLWPASKLFTTTGLVPVVVNNLLGLLRLLACLLGLLAIKASGHPSRRGTAGIHNDVRMP